MKIKLRSRPGKAGKRGDVGKTLLCLLALGRGAEAQQVLTPPPEVSILPAAQQEFQSGQAGFIPNPDATSGVPAGPPPLQWGPVSLRPHLLYRFLYGDGVQQTPGQQLTTAVNEISPGFLMGIGRNWNLDYTPLLRYYSNHRFHDGFDNSVRLMGGAVYEDWVFGVSQQYASSSAPLVETGMQTDTETYSTALTAAYRFNSKVSVDLSLDQNFLSAQTLESSKVWSTMDWLNYQFWPRLDAGVGAGFGYVKVSVGPNMTFEQLQSRISWRATDKLSLQVNAGVEIRQFLTGGESDLVNPIFGATFTYQPFDHTRFSLVANRTVAASYFVSEVTETTSVTVNLSQRLLERLELSLGGGYNTATYVASSTGVLANRVDDYYSFDVRLSTPFLKRGTASLTYQFNDNSSTLAGYTFSSSQVGLELAYKF